jgi:hypothetical protein
MKRQLLAFALLVSGLCSAQVPAASLAGVNTDTSWFEFSREDFNSAQSDFGMTATGTGYVFASSRTSNYMIRYFDAQQQSALLDLYYVQRNEKGFSEPKPFSPAINSATNNEGPLTFSGDGSTLIFTGNDPRTKKLVLFRSVRDKKSWSEPEMIAFCNDGASYMHPCFGYGDSVLFFASDRIGGHGAMDIYFSRNVNGTWSQPVNAGGKINTSYDEKFPFCSANGALYFSSNRQGGSGGLDIYAMALADSAFRAASVLNAPFNSDADDFGFCISPDMRDGFFSSNRGNEAHNDDIYSFRYRWPPAAVIDTLVRPELCFEFFEESTLKTGDTAKMKYIWKFSDGDTRTGYMFRKCFDTTGEYEVLLTIRDSSGGDVVISETGYVIPIEDPNYIVLGCPDSIGVHQSFTIDATSSAVKGYDIVSIAYDFGSGFCGTGMTIAHEYDHTGVYYPKIYLLLKSQETGTTESRCVVTKLIVN